VTVPRSPCRAQTHGLRSAPHLVQDQLVKQVQLVGQIQGYSLRWSVSAKTSALRRPRAFSLVDSFTTVWARPHGVVR
jgi:hypothetical protein